MRDSTDISGMESNEPEGAFIKIFDSMGKIGELYKIFIPNLIFSFLTLGIYRFWAKTRIRRYVMSRITVQGDGLEYTGTGGELFKGFLIVFFLVIVPFGVAPGIYANSIALNDPVTASLINAGQVAFFFLLLPVAIYRAYRYLLSRINWRGIRFALVGKTFGYWWRWLGFMALMPVTLGLIYPKMQVVLNKYLIGNARFGNQQFTFNVAAKHLYLSFIVMIVTAVVMILIFQFVVGLIFGGTILSTVFLTEGNEITLNSNLTAGLIAIMVVSAFLTFVVGLCLYTAVTAIYGRKVFNTFISGTKLGETAFKADIDYWVFAQFHFVNVFINALTLGLGYPFVICRYMKFLSEHIKGRDFDLVLQTIQIDRDELKTGEGLADALDVGAF